MARLSGTRIGRPLNRLVEGLSELMCHVTPRLRDCKHQTANYAVVLPVATATCVLSVAVATPNLGGGPL